MSVVHLVDAFALPQRTLVNQRVPKKLLIEQGTPTAADKRHVQDGIEELFWVAALKPNTVGIPAFKDEVREYLEIAVITGVLRSASKATRLIELIHRAIPYPVVLCVEQDGAVSLSLAHKRWSQGVAGEVVVEEVRYTASFQADAPTKHDAAFLSSLALSRLPTGDLYALYQGWLDRLVAFEAATISGAFNLPEAPERAKAQRDAVAGYPRLRRDLAALRAQAEREKQINRRVELNLAIKRLETEIAMTIQAL